MKLKFIFSFFTVLFFSIIQINAQRINAGIFMGVSNYQGDIVKYHLITRESNFSYGGFLRYSVSRKLSIKGNVFHGILSGSDANFKERVGRGFSFRTSILEGGVTMEYDLFSQGRYNKKNQYVPQRTPYLFTGIGAVMFTPTVNGLPEDAPELKILEKRENVFNFMVPFGAGYKFDLDEKITLGLEFATHIPFTDYLDGVSESAKKSNNDWYVFGGVTFAYWFNVGKKKHIEFTGR